MVGVIDKVRKRRLKLKLNWRCWPSAGQIAAGVSASRAQWRVLDGRGSVHRLLWQNFQN